MLGLEFVQIDVEIDVDDASFFPVADGDGDAGMGHGDGGIIVRTDAVGQTVGGRTTLAFRFWLGLDLCVGFA